jgi:carboxyl-terminal processing protease
LRQNRDVDTNTPPSTETGMTTEAKHEVLNRVLKALESKFYKPELLGQDWQKAVADHRARIESTSTADAFEQAMMALLQTLKTSHLGFFHGAARRASSRAALSATYLSDETSFGSRWIFQDVHDGGTAALAGVEPGNILLRVDGKEIVPPEHPVFPMGKKSTLDFIANDGTEKSVAVDVARPKGKKLHFVEPTLVQSKKLSDRVGYLKVAMFPGMLGVDVSNAMSSAVADLGNVERLIVDLRGNTGGGAGSLRLMSLLTPDRVPVGYAADKRWATRDLSTLRESFPRLGKIPSSPRFLWLLALRYLPAFITKSPIVLQSEGLGPKPYDGHIALLVDRHTASAAEMVAVFAKENKLAAIVGEKTAGRLLSATSVKVGQGFRLALPTGAYYTWHGTTLEGSPIVPDVVADYSWQERRTGVDGQLLKALEWLNA